MKRPANAYCLRRRRMRNAEAPTRPSAIVLGSGVVVGFKFKLKLVIGFNVLGTLGGPASVMFAGLDIP